MSEVKQRVIDIVMGRQPSEPKAIVALEPGQHVVTAPELTTEQAQEQVEATKTLAVHETKGDLQKRIERYREQFKLAAGEKPRIAFQMTPDGHLMPRDTTQLLPFIDTANMQALPKATL